MTSGAAIGCPQAHNTGPNRRAEHGLPKQGGCDRQYSPGISWQLRQHLQCHPPKSQRSDHVLSNAQAHYGLVLVEEMGIRVRSIDRLLHPPVARVKGLRPREVWLTDKIKPHSSELPPNEVESSDSANCRTRVYGIAQELCRLLHIPHLGWPADTHSQALFS